MLDELRAFSIIVSPAVQSPFVPASGGVRYVPSSWSVWYAACPRCGEPVPKYPVLFRKAHEDHHALLGC